MINHILSPLVLNPGKTREEPKDIVDAVNTENILDDAITAAKIVDGSITSGKLTSNAITIPELVNISGARTRSPTSTLPPGNWQPTLSVFISITFGYPKLPLVSTSFIREFEYFMFKSAAEGSRSSKIGDSPPLPHFRRSKK